MGHIKGHIPAGRTYFTSTQGALDVHDADLHTAIINIPFVNFTGIKGGISSAASVNQNFISLNNSAFVGGIGSGDFVFIYNSDSEAHIDKIVSVTSPIAYLDSPLDHSYNVTSTTVEKVIPNLADSITASASIANPVIFEVKPISSGQTWHLTRINASITDATAGADNLFGGAPARANGVVIRENKSPPRILTIWKENSDMSLDSGIDLLYHEKAGGGTIHGVRNRWTFQRAGAIVKLIQNSGDSLQIIIQDPMTDLVSFRVRAQGHLEVEKI